MTTQFPAANAPAEQQKWVRAAEKAIRDAETELQFIKSQFGSSLSAQKGTSGRLSDQVAKLQGTIDDLKEQANYLSGLIVVAAEAGTYDSPASPGDSTFRYYSGSPALQVTLRCPTGRLLVTYGSGECRVSPANNTSSTSASITFHMESPSGWTYDPTISRGRATAYGYQFAAPLVSSTPVSGIPTDEDITITVMYGIWSGTAVDAGAAHHTSNYLVAQVIPA